MKEMAFELMRAYNKKLGYRLRMYGTREEMCIKAIMKDEGSYKDGTLLNFLCQYDDFDIGLEEYCNLNITKKSETESTPTQATVSKDELKKEIIGEIKAENAIQQLGLLEKVLAQVIVQNQGESIKNEILGDFQKQAEKFMADNYGPITRKTTLEFEDRKVEFDEVLHEKFDTVLKFVQMDEPVFLTGQAGTGKNVLCKQVAKALGLDFYFTNAVTQEYKLTGFTDANGNYHDTQFYKAFKYGGLFMLDEMDASIPEVLIILNCAIANRYFDFPSGKDKDGNEVGGYTEAHPDFRIVSAGNTFGLGADYEYVGRNQLDMASLDRFAMVEIDYDVNIEKQVAEGDTELVEFVEELRKTSSDNGIRMVVSYRSIGRIAKMQKLMDLKDVLKTCLLKNLREDDIRTLVSNMDRTNRYTKTIFDNLV